MCTHTPPCPTAQAPDHAFARVMVRQDDIGWSLLCNRVIVFDDTGEILPDGTVLAPDRAGPRTDDRRRLRRRDVRSVSVAKALARSGESRRRVSFVSS
jgi:hypothetical protein